MHFARFTGIGKLKNHPELSYTQNGKSSVKFQLQINRFYHDKSKDEKKTISDTYFCSAYNDKAELIAQHLHAGSEVFISGPLSIYSTKKEDGSYSNFTTITVYDISFISRDKQDKNQAQELSTKQEKHQQLKANNYLSDDDIPF